MKLADMRERIVIEEAATEVDEFDNHINSYQEYCTRWAYVNMKTGKEEFEAGRTTEKVTLSFVIRLDSVTRLICPGTHRIKFQDKYFNITSVDNFKFRNNTLTLIAEETDDKTAD